MGAKNSGRLEHAVFGTRLTGNFVFKATKGPKFGFWPHFAKDVVSSRLDEVLVMCPAAPAQYLVRMKLLDVLAPELNWLEGFAFIDGRFSIVTSQRWYPSRNATWTEISRWLDALGFKPVRADIYEDPTRWHHPEQNLALFDVGESNIIHSDGQLVPIDIIPVPPQGLLRECLLRALGLE